MIKKFEELQIDTMWFALGLIGIVIAITKAKEETKKFSTIVVINTTIAGITCCILAPMIFRDYAGVDTDGLLWAIAFLGGLSGMRIVTALHKLDFVAIITKKIGG